MKNLFILFFALLITVSAKATDEKTVKSSISKVTVYSQGAQIYRTASYSISSGVTEVIIEGISSQIDPKSLQVNATGNVIILDSKYSIFYPKPTKEELEGLPLKIRREISLLEDSLKNLNYDIQDIQDAIDVMVATKNILANNGAIRGQGKVNDSIPLLKNAIEYYTSKMMEINKEIQKLKRVKGEKVSYRKGMNERLNTLKNYQNNANLTIKPKGPVHRITITLKTNEYAKGKLNVSYLVSGAGWTPIYDLRSEVASNQVNLSYKAQVFQNTGIDWNEIPLSISTNNPYHNKTKPTLHPWYVDYFVYNRYNKKEKDRRDNYKESGKLQETTKSLDYDYPAASGTVPAAEELEDAITSDQFVQVVDHIISAEFKIDLPYTIKSNNEQHMVLVKNVDLDAEFKYYSVPKFDASAYLVAQISKLDELQLVPAKANIFFDGSYLGETYLNPSNMDDTLNLSLGKDPNIIVKRTLLKQECKDKVIGTKMERKYAYAIEVKNLKSKAIELIIQDQIPITQNTEIEIETLELSKGDLDERTGIIEWKYTIKPKGKKDIKFTYEIKHDKDKNVPII